MARIVLNTFGSFGDLHPFLALGIELKRRGHQTTVATSEVYRTKIEAEGIGFAPVRPDVGKLLDNPEMLKKLWDPRWGTEYLLRKLILPNVEESYEDLVEASRQADLLVTHTAGPAGPVVAEALRLRWISIVLQPAAFVSAYDPPVFAQAPWLKSLERFGRWPFQLALTLGTTRVRSWMRPIYRLRERLGLTEGELPMFKGQFSPYGTLALFSPQFAQAQPDWPANVTTTGFVYYDKRGEGFQKAPKPLASGLAEFLNSGPAPIVFTLGSSAVMQPGTFYRESVEAARLLGCRAVLLAGLLDPRQFSDPLPEWIFVADYAPYSELLPRAAAVVHQGGIGTTAQALRAGRPMLIVPWAHDQPDNAYRLGKLGVARMLARARYTGASAARELKPLLEDSAYAATAHALRERLLAEDGLKTACDAIECVLR